MGIIVAAVACHIVLWLAAEKWFMAGRDLSFGARAALAALVREGLAPVLMVTALAGRSMAWRGNDLGESWRSRSLVPASSVNVDVRPVEQGSEITVGDSVTTVLLPGHVDSGSVGAIEREIVEHLRPGASVIVDGNAVIYMSAAGVRTFATVLHRAAENGARVVFCRFNGAAADCLAVSGFADLFDVAKSTEEASGRLQPVGGTSSDGRLHPPVDAG
jgi:anti-anti-sigma factor